MNFPIAEYVEICHALAEGAPDDWGLAEKRLGPRIAVEGQVLVTVVRPTGEIGQSFSAIARDLSINGIGLIQRRPPQRGSRLIVQLPRLHATPLRLLCDVRFVRELADGVYAVGATFLDEVAQAVHPTDDAAEIERLRRAVIE